MARHKNRHQSNAVVAGVNQSAGKRWFRVVAIVLIILILLATLAGGAVWVYKKYAQKDIQPQVCSNELLQNASLKVQPQATKELQPIAEEIKTLPNYQADPNCVAIVTTYYVNISDGKNAQQYYNMLNEVYQPDTGYNDIIKGQVLTPEQFKPVIEFLQQQAEQIKKNSSRGPEVPAQ